MLINKMFINYFSILMNWKYMNNIKTLKPLPIFSTNFTATLKGGNVFPNMFGSNNEKAELNKFILDSDIYT
jgi:hypothetical protein